MSLTQRPASCLSICRTQKGKCPLCDQKFSRDDVLCAGFKVLPEFGGSRRRTNQQLVHQKCDIRKTLTERKERRKPQRPASDVDDS